MSYSFLDNLWDDANDNPAYTSAQTNPAGTRYTPPAQQQFTAPAQQVAAPPQTFAMPMRQPTYAQQAGDQFDYNPALNRPAPLDANTELKNLLKTSLALLHENTGMRGREIAIIQQGRAEIQNLTYMTYGMLAICALITLLLLAVGYKVYKIQK